MQFCCESPVCSIPLNGIHLNCKIAHHQSNYGNIIKINKNLVFCEEKSIKKNFKIFYQTKNRKKNDQIKIKTKPMFNINLFKTDNGFHCLFLFFFSFSFSFSDEENRIYPKTNGHEIGLTQDRKSPPKYLNKYQRF